MIRLRIEDSDSEEFIGKVERLIEGTTRAYSPAEVAVLRIDNWFGPRWLRFSGKLLGAVGLYKRKLTFPPFVPNRVLSQTWFVRNADSGEMERDREKTFLHRWRFSSANLSHRVSLKAPHGAFFWFSGQSSASARGCLMAYVPTPEGHWCWYAGFSESNGWRPAKVVEISIAELEDLEQAGRPAA